ncbi:hypothetical protein [Nocardia suismassiliense]|uniref:hypothetical protein n=1 Tax=Nocardia suismassiliense TaxID=2077092 RepID=UPI00131EE568|nr:hypothetical protein [Nocardia suismassiliense]
MPGVLGVPGLPGLPGERVVAGLPGEVLRLGTGVPGVVVVLGAFGFGVPAGVVLAGDVGLVACVVDCGVVVLAGLVCEFWPAGWVVEFGSCFGSAAWFSVDAGSCCFDGSPVAEDVVGPEEVDGGDTD